MRYPVALFTERKTAGLRFHESSASKEKAPGIHTKSIAFNSIPAISLRNGTACWPGRIHFVLSPFNLADNFDDLLKTCSMAAMYCMKNIHTGVQNFNSLVSNVHLRTILRLSVCFGKFPEGTAIHAHFNLLNQKLWLKCKRPKMSFLNKHCWCTGNSQTTPRNSTASNKGKLCLTPLWTDWTLA